MDKVFKNRITRASIINQINSGFKDLFGKDLKSESLIFHARLIPHNFVNFKNESHLKISLILDFLKNSELNTIEELINILNEKKDRLHFEDTKSPLIYLALSSINIDHSIEDCVLKLSKLVLNIKYLFGLSTYKQKAYALYTFLYYKYPFDKDLEDLLCILKRPYNDEYKIDQSTRDIIIYFLDLIQNEEYVNRQLLFNHQINRKYKHCKEVREKIYQFNEDFKKKNQKINFSILFFPTTHALYPWYSVIVKKLIAKENSIIVIALGEDKNYFEEYLEKNEKVIFINTNLFVIPEIIFELKFIIPPESWEIYFHVWTPFSLNVIQNLEKESIKEVKNIIPVGDGLKSFTLENEYNTAKFFLNKEHKYKSNHYVSCLRDIKLFTDNILEEFPKELTYKLKNKFQISYEEVTERLKFSASNKNKLEFNREEFKNNEFNIIALRYWGLRPEYKLIVDYDQIDLIINSIQNTGILNDDNDLLIRASRNMDVNAVFLEKIRKLKKNTFLLEERLGLEKYCHTLEEIFLKKPIKINCLYAFDGYTPIGLINPFLKNDINKIIVGGDINYLKGLLSENSINVIKKNSWQVVNNLSEMGFGIFSDLNTVNPIDEEKLINHIHKNGLIFLRK